MAPFSADLAFAHRLADEADRVSMAHFRSEDVRLVTKGDGTPVSVVDQMVEKAMLRLVLAERPDDALLGEEIGPIPGVPPHRWIFDGIDGTHNFGPGRKHWATIVALERDGEPVLGVVTAPALGRRWWAERGGGAWTAPLGSDGRPDVAAAEQLHVSSAGTGRALKVCVTPWIGFLDGWRGELATRFEQPAEPRSQCFALDGAMVAEGRLDATVVMMGGPWDYAATKVMVTEAGGRFSDAWGGDRLDTTTAVFSSPHATDAVMTVVAALRPTEPDRPVIATTTLKVQPKHWSDFDLRHMVSMSARTRVEHAPTVVLDLVDERLAELQRPLVGITTDGIVRRGLRARGNAVSTAPITDAALEFLQALGDEQRRRATLAMDAIEWRQWFNVHMNHVRHGVMLEDLAPAQRDAALGIVRATLSHRGYEQARSIMRVNELLAELTGDWNAFGEWPYFVSIFGAPGGAEPWGWQIDGHHLCVNCVVFDDRIVTTPAFMGAEPRRIDTGRLAGTHLFAEEEARGLDLIRSLDADQRAGAIIYPSIHPDELPPRLQNVADGRMQAGAFHDNLVLPYQGVAGSALGDAQRRLLEALLGAYVGWNADAHAEVRRREVVTHLDDTWFSWYGGVDDEAPFYYRVHSPVILVEFDHHPGVVFDNEIPTRHHVHTVVRTPHGGDYGADLLREHYERSDHHGR